MVTVPIGVTESGEGFTKFPDGTLMQYGSESVSAGEIKIEVNFQIPFTSDIVSVSACPIWVNDSKVFLTTGNLNGSYKLGVSFYITDYELGLTKVRAFQWIAIGRWK